MFPQDAGPGRAWQGQHGSCWVPGVTGAWPLLPPEARGSHPPTQLLLLSRVSCSHAALSEVDYQQEGHLGHGVTPGVQSVVLLGHSRAAGVAA